MEPQPTKTVTTKQPEQGQREKSDVPQIVVVDFGKRQTRKQVKRLRKGQGKLMTRVEGIVSELVAAGTVKSSAQPIVIVVREEIPMPWPFE